MAEEVVYADLRVPGGTGETPTPGRCPRGCPPSPRLALAGGLLLGAAIGALGVLGVLGAAGVGRGGSPVPGPSPATAGCNGSAAELAAALRRRLCRDAGDDDTDDDDTDDDDTDDDDDGGPCGLCPPGWTPRGAACFWVSSAPRDWDGAARACAARAARLLAPRDLAAAVSLEGVAGDPNPLWVGLRHRPLPHAWTWPDGSRHPPPTGGGDCGVLRRGRLASESCGAELRWLCRRDALLL